MDTGTVQIIGGGVAVVLVALIHLEASKPRLALPVAFRLKIVTTSNC